MEQKDLVNSIANGKQSSTLYPEILNGQGGNSLEIEISNNTDIERITELPTDELDSIKRRLLIAINAYGLHNLSQVASYVGMVTPSQLRKLLDEDKQLLEILKRNEVVCLTKAEIVAKLCIEAETANRSQDRINALCRLMEFRGLSAPEGGAKSFQRLVAKFRRDPANLIGTLEKR